jgi:hypothetical protein
MEFVIGVTSGWRGLLQNSVAVTDVRVYGALTKRRLTRKNEQSSRLPWDWTGISDVRNRPPTACFKLWTHIDTVGLI